MPAKFIFTAALWLLFVFTLLAQQKQEDYSTIFLDDYQKAVRFLRHEKWMVPLIQAHDLNPSEVIAVGFPELVRYNSLQDKIETFALESLYVQYGKEYANFSIGLFQLKPSFVESIEIDFFKLGGAKKLFEEFHIAASDTVKDWEGRFQRLKRMKDKQWLTSYLCLYFKVMEARYPNWRSSEEKIKFFSCAYNCGYWKSKIEIDSFLKKKFFYVGLLTSKKYCYADIAWYYFQQH